MVTILGSVWSWLWRIFFSPLADTAQHLIGAPRGLFLGHRSSKGQLKSLSFNVLGLLPLRYYRADSWEFQQPPPPPRKKRSSKGKLSIRHGQSFVAPPPMGTTRQVILLKQKKSSKLYHFPWVLCTHWLCIVRILGHRHLRICVANIL